MLKFLIGSFFAFLFATFPALATTGIGKHVVLVVHAGAICRRFLRGVLGGEVRGKLQAVYQGAQGVYQDQGAQWVYQDQGARGVYQD